MINLKVAMMLPIVQFLISIPLLSVPIAGYAFDVQKAPVKIKTTIKPRQVRASGFQQPVCSGVPLPDIDVKSINIEGPGKHGKPHMVKLNIVNIGQCATGKFSVKASMRVQAQGIDKVVQLGSKGSRSLKPCKSKNCGEASYHLAFRFTPQYNHAFYDITVDVDAGNNVNEYRENNNSAHIELKIQNY